MPVTLPSQTELPYHEDSAALVELIADDEWSIFLDSGFPKARQGRYDIIAAEPIEVLVTRGPITEIKSSSEVIVSEDDPFLLLRKRLGNTVAGAHDLPFGGGAIGYFGYDLARRLEKLPEISFDAENIYDMAVGIYDWAVVVDHQVRRSWLVSTGRDPLTTKKWPDLIERFSEITKSNKVKNKQFRVLDPASSNLTKQQYARAFHRIKRYLYDGDCYQVNLAQRFSAPCEGSPWSAYVELRNQNAAPFSAYLNFPGVQVLSSSPERFLQVTHGRVETKPIKGTRPRKSDPIEDKREITELKNSLKDRAENLMIVDLLRNDISKACRLDSVHVPKLFNLESFATVHHLVSTVRGELKKGRDAIDLLRDCFPGGSITGAPKIRAMEIIEELEPHRRGVYCGSIGYIGFDGNMDTNIVIRTMVHSDNTIRFWVGGGIVIDSVMDQEYQECFDKGAAMLKVLAT